MTITTDPKRLNSMTTAILQGLDKSEFVFNDSLEDHTWDLIAADIERIHDDGLEVDLPNE